MVENDENSQIVVTILTSKVKDEGTVLSLLLEVIFLVLTEKMKEVEVFFFFFNFTKTFTILVVGYSLARHLE